MGSWVQNTAYAIVTFILEQITVQWSNQAWEWFSYFFAPPLAVIQDPTVETLTQVCVAAALGVLPVIIGWYALRESIQRIDGAATLAPETIVRRAIMTGTAVTGTSLAAWFIGTLADNAREVLAAVGLDINLLQDFFFFPVGSPATLLVTSLVFLIGAIILTIQRVVIMCEFTVLLIVGPLMGLGLMREGGSSTWAMWLREVVSLVITPIIQMLVLLLFLRKFGGAGPLDMFDRAASLGFLWVLYNTPRWARQMVYQVGTGGAAVNMVVQAGRAAAMKQMLMSAKGG